MLLDEISNFPRVCMFSFAAKIRANDLAISPQKLYMCIFGGSRR